ncbi:MAG: hypothetical protein A2096_08505 [Spirochaetes bacterium GWF1_41_5]|nr:MAG: hypothetical protein A2096_08505 [Spirochaetes bacterium GWF1_41_5]
MTKILVFSDIHFPSRITEFPEGAIAAASGNADMVLGLGDYDDKKAVDFLYRFSDRVHLVAGNMDAPILKKQLPQTLIVPVERMRIGLVHGWGIPFGIRARVQGLFSNIDLLCYGHSHEAFYGVENDQYFFNPGSLASEPRSFGIITVNGNNADCRIIKI